MVALSESTWEGLLAAIEAGEVVPIVGKDLLRIETPDGAGTTLYRMLADQWVQEEGVDPTKLPDGYSLSDVIALSERYHRRPTDVYPWLKQGVERVLASVAVPAPLVQLAHITPLRLFVSTTMDPWLSWAVAKERACAVHAVAYSHTKPRDLPERFNDDEAPYIFKLFGQISALADFAVTDADLLEFLHGLQSAERRPRRLLDELKQKHLLLLGVSLPDWMERTLLRLLRTEPFWGTRRRDEYVVDREAESNPSLGRFLRSFSRETVVVPGGDAGAFVAELYRRWLARSSARPAGSPGGSVQVVGVDREAPPIFLSYDRNDLEAVQRLKSRLEKARLNVWLDMQDLLPGQEWEPGIRQGLQRCGAFVAVISRSTEARSDAFFRREWAWAVAQLPRFAGADRPFLFPVVLDAALKEQARLVPEDFRGIEWSVAPEGEADAAFVDQLVQLSRRLQTEALRRVETRSPLVRGIA